MANNISSRVNRERSTLSSFLPNRDDRWVKWSVKLCGWFLAVITVIPAFSIVAFAKANDALKKRKVTPYPTHTSDGTFFKGKHQKRKFKSLERRVKMLQRGSATQKSQKSKGRKSPMKKFSKNWQKQQKKIGKIHAKIGRIRNDFQQKLTQVSKKNLFTASK